MYRDKYRSLNDTLWKPQKPKQRKMVDLDSDTEAVADAPVPKEAVPREILLARASNMLDLPRFR